MAKTTKDFIVSVSALDKFWTCARRYYLSRKWDPAKPSEWLKLGQDAHAIMAGQAPVNVAPNAVRLAAKLKKLADDNHYVLLPGFVEQRQYVTLTSSITLIRVIDAGGYDANGLPVLIDWKTAGMPWDTYQTPIGLQAPKGSGFQGAGYLIPPEEHTPFAVWPSRIDFLVAPANGPSEVHQYYRNQEDEDDLIRAARLMRDAVNKGWYPKHRGISCDRCDWAAACFQSPGWEELYERRTHGTAATTNEKDEE